MLIIKKIKNRGKRVMSYVRGEHVDRKARPVKKLTRILAKNSGRMKTGKISVRHRGGGTRRKYRIIDFKQREGEFTIERIERDPNRKCFIALVRIEGGEQAYLLATTSMKPGDIVSAGAEVELKEGNRTLLGRIPTGSIVCNIEMTPGAGGQIARSGGSGAVVMGCEKGMVQLKMPSGEVRLVPEACFATIGQMSNPENSAVRIGKAGRMRKMGRRPQVRGKAMNPVDHPHGGGEGNQPIGLKHPKTKWGRPALGVRTRNKEKKSSKYILKRRSKN